MKRFASSERDSATKKRQKSNFNGIFEDPSSVLSLPTLLTDREAVDDDKFLVGKVNRIWPPKDGNLLFELATSYISEGHGHTTRLNVCLSGSCAQFFDHFDLKPQDDIFLLLKGSEIKMEDEKSLRVNYSKGVVLKRARKSQISIVNTWELLKSNDVAMDDWFTTPGVGTTAIPTPGALIREVYSDPQAVKSTTVSCRTIADDIQSPHQSELGARKKLANSSSHVEASSSSRKDHGPANAGHYDEAIRETSTIMTKKAYKRLKKAQNAQNKDNLDGEIGNNSVETWGRDMKTLRDGTEGKQRSDGRTTGEASYTLTNYQDTTNFANYPQQIQESLNPGGPVLLPPDKYQLLDNLTPSNRAVHFIGIVTSITSPSKTSKGEWMCCVKLADPSNIIVDNFSSGPEGFSVNCFSKKYQQWLPCPKLGDILILRNIKVVDWRGKISGVGYPDKLLWAIYLPDKGQVYHGQLGNAPTSEGIIDGLGYIHSPFFQPGPSEIKYILKLSDWWRGVLKDREEALGEVQQIDGGEVQADSLLKRPSREHRLIGETSPDSIPNGFFDCTVEILHGWANDNGVYSIYVTDYTRNEQTRPCCTQWCPASLQELVLQIEMWDEAAEVGPTMKEGEYYYIQNARLMIRRSGFVEGKVSENKIRRLYEHEAVCDPRLQALLDRKKAWMDVNDVATTSFEHQLIQDIVENKFFNCTVEVVHTIPAQNANRTEGPAFIFVTDYTSHPNISSVMGDMKDNVHLVEGLEGRVVKIALWGKQVNMAEQVSVGSYYLIKKLRLKYTNVGRELRGFIGGGERLIQKLNPRNTDNIELQSLLQRKDNWIKNKTSCQTENKYKESTLPEAPVIKRRATRPFCSIKEVTMHSISPNKFRIIAKPVDFYPRQLKKALVIHCRQCGEDIPETKKACYKCADFEHEFVQFRYQLFVLLQDEAGDQLKLSISDDCTLFEGLKRGDIRDGGALYDDFYSKIKPLVGVVTELHEGKTSIEKIPFVSFVINHWTTSNGQPAYNIAEFEGVA